MSSEPPAEKRYGYREVGEHLEDITLGDCKKFKALWQNCIDNIEEEDYYKVAPTSCNTFFIQYEHCVNSLRMVSGLSLIK